MHYALPPIAVVSFKIEEHGLMRICHCQDGLSSCPTTRWQHGDSYSCYQPFYQPISNYQPIVLIDRAHLRLLVDSPIRLQHISSPCFEKSLCAGRLTGGLGHAVHRTLGPLASRQGHQWRLPTWLISIWTEVTSGGLQTRHRFAQPALLCLAMTWSAERVAPQPLPQSCLRRLYRTFQRFTHLKANH